METLPNSKSPEKPPQSAGTGRIPARVRITKVSAAYFQFGPWYADHIGDECEVICEDAWRNLPAWRVGARSDLHAYAWVLKQDAEPIYDEPSHEICRECKKGEALPVFNGTCRDCNFAKAARLGLIKEESKHSQYKRKVRLPLITPIAGADGPITHVEVLMDIYDFQHAFKINNPAADHALKKLARMGTDHNDRVTDLSEARDSITRAIELEAK